MSEVPHPLTLTHARLRRAQGDKRGAMAILEALIDAGEEDEKLVELYLALGGDEQRAHFEPQLRAEGAVLPAAPETLADEFRRSLGRRDSRETIRRLERWLLRVRRG